MNNYFYTRRSFKLAITVFSVFSLAFSPVFALAENNEVDSKNNSSLVKTCKESDSNHTTINPKVSVIMPVYNNKDYLEQSVGSVLSNTLTDLELICIDDGSTDGSSEVLDNYSKNDKRVVVVHQENQGVSKTRQNGLNLAKGKYVAFVDSDDRVSPDTYKTAVEYMEKHDADIVVWGWVNCPDKHDEHSKVVRNDCKLDKEEVFKDWWKAKKHRASIYLWNKLYKREIIVDNAVSFNPKQSVAEDEGFNLCVYSHTKKVVHIPHSFYYYTTNSNSIFSKITFSKLLKGYSEMWKYVNEHYKQHNIKKVGFFRRVIYFFSIYKKEIWPLIKNFCPK